MTWLRPVTTTSSSIITVPELSSREGDATDVFLREGGRWEEWLLAGSSSCWYRCRSQRPGDVGRLMEQEDSKWLNKL